MSDFKPSDAKQVSEVVTWAVAEQQPLELRGGGTKQGLGRPLQVEHLLDLSGLAGVRDYEPAELVLTAGAATPLDEIETLLAERNQMLAFEPPDWRALLGTTERRQTLAGVLACNLSGPRRLKGGAARDHLLGFAGVNGRGELFKSGGKVVKNVTGYDLCKLIAGSHGTLTALTEISIKVLPRAETGRTLLLIGLSHTEGVRLLTEAMNSEHEISGAAFIPASLTDRSNVGAVARGGRSITALRLEGPEPSVLHRTDALIGELAGRGETAILDADDTTRLWHEIRDVLFLVDPPDRLIWRLSVPPATGAAVAGEIARHGITGSILDWSGGLIWAAADPAAPDGGAGAVRAAVAAHGGYATLIRGPASLRASVDVFEPLAAPLAELSARVKASFDPLKVLNPGRMYRGV